jgi:hypothetical protein
MSHSHTQIQITPSLSDQAHAKISALVEQVIQEVSEQFEAGLTAQVAALIIENQELRERIACLESAARGAG